MKKLTLRTLGMAFASLAIGCSNPSEQLLDGESRIVGGSTFTGLSSIGMLVKDSRYQCTATLVDEDLILTTAECAAKIDDDDYFVVGSSPSDLDSWYEIAQIFLHPEYDSRTGYADIAAIRLSSKPNLVPARLTTERVDDLVGETAYLVGFGRSRSGEAANKRAARTEVTAYDSTRVQVEGIGNACDGDEGAALLRVHPVSQNVELIGTVSYFDGNCERYTVATRIDAFASLLSQLPGVNPSIDDSTGGDGSTGNGRDDSPSSQDLLVVGFGDSVTDGYCSTRGNDYVSLLVENNNSRYPNFQGRDLRSTFASVNLQNKAISGTTSCNYSASSVRQQIRSSSYQADRSIVLITLGGNDLIHDYSCANPRECSSYCADYVDTRIWASRYKTRMKSIIRAFQEELPGEVDIFIANIYDPTDDVGDIHNAPIPLPRWSDGKAVLDHYNRVIAEIAAETSSVLVDMRAAMLGHGIHYDDSTNPHYDASNPSYWYCSNLEDPNDAGYHAIRKEFWSKISSEIGF